MTAEDMKAKGYYSLFADIYRMLQSFPTDPNDADEKFWDNAINTQFEIMKKYRGTDAESISGYTSAAIIEEMTRLYRKRAARRDLTAQ